jgi:hypothetical protein
LEDILDSANVYFQPPPSVQMAYPCIVYARDYMQVNHADNIPHLRYKRYLVTSIDRDPDSPIPDQLHQLPMCTYDRFYTADGLNHDVFRLFF